MRLLTPAGTGGIAVVRATESRERQALLRGLCLRDGRPAMLVAGGPPISCVLRAGSEVIDEVIAVDLGAVGLEVHLHGATAVIAAVQTWFGPFDREPAGPAQHLLLQALHPAQLALALEQMSPGFEPFLTGLDRLAPAARRAEAAAALRRTRTALALAEPCRLVLAGAQNAGKSTLMNRLLFRERVLVGPLPGLTRDPVREIAVLAGYPYEVVDTAGEGRAIATADRRAIELGRNERAGNTVVLVVDGSVGPEACDRELLAAEPLVVRSKADLAPSCWPEDFPCHLMLSCVDPAASAVVRQALGEAMRQRRELPPAGPVGGPAALDQSQLQALLARC